MVTEIMERKDKKDLNPLKWKFSASNDNIQELALVLNLLHYENQILKEPII
jgi:hypothetical protein